MFLRITHDWYIGTVDSSVLNLRVMRYFGSQDTILRPSRMEATCVHVGCCNQEMRQIGFFREISSGFVSARNVRRLQPSLTYRIHPHPCQRVDFGACEALHMDDCALIANG